MLTEVEEPVLKYYTFKEFVKQWEERIKQAETEDRYNAVLLMLNYQRDLMGAFYLSSASDGEKDRAVKLAELTTGVLIELKSDGYIKRVR